MSGPGATVSPGPDALGQSLVRDVVKPVLTKLAADKKGKQKEALDTIKKGWDSLAEADPATAWATFTELMQAARR